MSDEYNNLVESMTKLTVGTTTAPQSPTWPTTPPRFYRSSTPSPPPFSPITPPPRPSTPSPPPFSPITPPPRQSTPSPPPFSPITPPPRPSSAFSDISDTLPSPEGPTGPTWLQQASDAAAKREVQIPPRPSTPPPPSTPQPPPFSPITPPPRRSTLSPPPFSPFSDISDTLPSPTAPTGPTWLQQASDAAEARTKEQEAQPLSFPGLAATPVPKGPWDGLVLGGDQRVGNFWDPMDWGTTQWYSEVDWMDLDEWWSGSDTSTDLLYFKNVMAFNPPEKQYYYTGRCCSSQIFCPH